MPFFLFFFVIRTKNQTLILKLTLLLTIKVTISFCFVLLLGWYRFNIGQLRDGTELRQSANL